MIFSCVVDADFLDTETFFEPAKESIRGNYPSLVSLLPKFEAFMAGKLTGANPTRVNRIRAEVLRQCEVAASGQPGAYSLTVPTGGGKTLSSMAFALHHAAKPKDEKQRIIYVIPYTSIIEQTAKVFRDIFGEAVLEHHSNLDVGDPAMDSARSRLACENWDAPIIVTTSVQFFESLFAARTSRSRKLHNIVNSVVILDEAQLLPPEFLSPILHVLDELRKNYRVTLLITTATQPALGPQPNFRGLAGITEIVPDPGKLHEDLKRVTIEIPADLHTATSWDVVAADLSRHESVLCVVNRRNDARDLWRRMPPDTIHLSRLMCGEHLSERISEIKTRLKTGLPTRVVSTQLVEAGVDIDFPVVYRALAGLDSLAQAAGRCNREGLLDSGQMRVFVPPTSAPPGILRQAEGVARQLLSQEAADHFTPAKFSDFFRQLYWIQGPRLDKEGILNDLVPKGETEFRYSFRSAAGKFRLIDDSAYAAVVVPYQGGTQLIRRLDQAPANRDLLRKLQRFTVNLPRRVHGELLKQEVIREVSPGIFVLTHPAFYDENLGFVVDASVVYDPNELFG